MRIHRLEVQAFGPFAEPVVVDLDAVSTAGLFLVHGPTGSGKTSLLDAICFALYADVPGSRSKRGLRSDHAGPELVPRVVLELTVGGRRLRITRSPEWQRPKRRGTGTVREQASVVLEELRGARWEVLSTRHDEVADVVKDLLGMGLRQFSAVVLLPQGDFAAFLRATPEDRREILQRLFDISVYADVESWLAETRRTAAAALETARHDLEADLRTLDDALAEVRAPTEDESGSDGFDASPLSLLDAPVDTLAERLAAAGADLENRITASLALVDAAETLEVSAQTAVSEGRTVLGHRERGEAASDRLATVEAESAAHTARTARLDAAERASSVRGHVAARERAATEVTAAHARREHSHAAVVALGVDPGEDPAALAGRTHALDDVASVLATEASAVAELRTRLERETATRDALRTRLQAATTALPDARAAASAATDAVSRLALEAARAPDHEEALTAVRRRLALLDAVDADRAGQERLVPRLAEVRDAYLVSQQVLIELQERRISGMAAEIAVDLHDGAPCPVCGSVEHPEPAVPSDPVTTEALAAAQEALSSAQQARSTVEAESADLAASVRTRLDLLDGATREDSTAELEALTVAAAAGRAAVTGLETARAEAERLESRAGSLATDAERLDATVAGHDTRIEELVAAAVAAAERLERSVAAHADCPCAGTDAARHRRVAGALDELARAVELHDASLERCTDATRGLDAALAEAGFTDADAATSAALDAAATDRLRDAVLAHERARAAAVAVLAEPEVRTALAADPPEVGALQDAAAAARREVLAVRAEHDILNRASRALHRVAPALVAGLTEVSRLADRAARVRDVADAVGGTGGENTLRMRLTSFVLAARLETVATLANERLAVMGGGRYLLEHTDDRAARGARSGLGLRVLDQWTGRTRETASLSGGESFMASLALALGLADAVRAESGGLDLGTLFIDEGFGSLDDDSLEEVLTVLDGLREGGRAVGVVSHVADLRTRIPHQVVVGRTGTCGSEVSVRVDGRAPAA